MKSKVTVKIMNPETVTGYNGINEKDFLLAQAKMTDLNYDGNYPVSKVEETGDFTHSPLYHGVVAEQNIEQGEVVLELTGEWKHKPSRTTIQLGEKHIDSGIGGYVNHSCEPTCAVLVRIKDMTFKEQFVPWKVGIKGTLTSMIIGEPKPVLVAVKPILKGEEVTFNYNQTEECLAEPFDCICGSEKCMGKITGWNKIMGRYHG